MNSLHPKNSLYPLCEQDTQLIVWEMKHPYLVPLPQTAENQVVTKQWLIAQLCYAMDTPKLLTNKMSNTSSKQDKYQMANKQYNSEQNDCKTSHVDKCDDTNKNDTNKNHLSTIKDKNLHMTEETAESTMIPLWKWPLPSIISLDECDVIETCHDGNCLFRSILICIDITP